MLRLSDFVTCRIRYYNQSLGVYFSALEHCRNMKLENIPSSDTNKQFFRVVTVD